MINKTDDQLAEYSKNQNLLGVFEKIHLNC